MKKLLIALLVVGLMAPAMAFGQSLESRVSDLEEGMQEMTKEGMKLKETVIGMKKMGFHFYGSLRTHVGYYDADDEFGVSASGAPMTVGPAIDDSIAGPDDSGLLVAMSPQTRFGAKAIASEDFYGVIEFGLGEGSDNYLRLAYGVWDFGSGKLTMGKDYTPATFLGYSSMIGDIGDTGDAVMLRGGFPYIGRQTQVKLSFGDFDLAFIEGNNVEGGALAYGGDVDFVLPRIEAAYVFRLPSVNIRPVAGYQTYDVENIFGTTSDESIDSWLFGLGVSADITDKAYVKATVTYLQNPANYGATNVGLDPGIMGAVQSGASSVEDATALYGTLVGGAQMNDMVAVEGGIGYMSGELDVGPGVTAEQTAMLYYLQSRISLSKNVTLIPEIGMLDRGDAELTGAPDDDLGTLTYFDVNFRCDF